MMSEMDVNAIAGTLKLYFRELPEPLFTDEFYPNFAEGIGKHKRPKSHKRHLPLLSTAALARACAVSFCHGPHFTLIREIWLHGPLPMLRGLPAVPTLSVD